METTTLVQQEDSEHVKELKWQVASLKAQLDAERCRIAVLRGNGLLKCEAIDLYPGEQLDFVLSILKQVQSRCPEGSRPHDIITSLLTVNQPIGVGQEILDEVSRVFKGGLPEKESDVASLRRIGFSYTPSRKHPKLRFHDHYMFVLPSTPSENRRGGRNCLAEISKCIALCQKV